MSGAMVGTSATHLAAAPATLASEASIAGQASRTRITPSFGLRVERRRTTGLRSSSPATSAATAARLSRLLPLLGDEEQTNASAANAAASLSNTTPAVAAAAAPNRPTPLRLSSGDLSPLITEVAPVSPWAIAAAHPNSIGAPLPAAASAAASAASGSVSPSGSAAARRIQPQRLEATAPPRTPATAAAPVSALAAVSSVGGGAATGAATTSSRRILLQHGQFVPLSEPTAAASASNSAAGSGGSGRRAAGASSKPPGGAATATAAAAVAPAFVSNSIRSARYTWYTFLPLNLAQQLMRPSNFYFVLIAILQVIPAISISGGKPSILLPLLLVLIVSGAKDAVEDLKRARADREENQRAYLVLRPVGAAAAAEVRRSSKTGSGTSVPLARGGSGNNGGSSSGSDPTALEFVSVPCASIRVGDIVRVEDEQSFPADLVLIYSALEQTQVDESGAGGLGGGRRSTLTDGRRSTLAGLDDAANARSAQVRRASLALRASIIQEATGQIDVDGHAEEASPPSSAPAPASRATRSSAPGTASSSSPAPTPAPVPRSTANPGMVGGSFAYVETSSLDGESALRPKLAVEFTKDLCDARAIAEKLHVQLRVDQPNGKLDKFGGVMVKYQSAAAAAAAAAAGVAIGSARSSSSSPASTQALERVLSVDNLLVRGSRLRNTGFVYGVACYTGEECKIRQDCRARSSARVKRSSVERFMNRQIYYMAALQFLFCLVGGVASGLWADSHRDHSYLFPGEESAVLVGLQRFFTWYIIFSGFVPISLLVSLELVKFAQGQFMGFDLAMTHFVPTSASARAHANVALWAKGGAGAAGGDTNGKPVPTPSHKEEGKDKGMSVKLTTFPSSSPPSDGQSNGGGGGGGSGEPVDFGGELQFARAQTSGLNEELGLVKFILSDKTGTLTCNSMDARKAFIGNQQYGTGTTDFMAAVRAAAQSQAADGAADAPSSAAQLAPAEVNLPPVICAARFGLPLSCAHVNFNARDQVLLALQGHNHNHTPTPLSDAPPSPSSPSSPDQSTPSSPDPALLRRQQSDVHSYFMCLALCNTVFPTIDEYDRVVYKASSPDEESLVEFARFHGYELLQRCPPFVSMQLTGPAALCLQMMQQQRRQQQQAATMATAASNPDDLSAVATRLPSGSGAGVSHHIEDLEQLALCDFTSKRKRMTVVVRDAAGVVHVLCKGADATMLPLLSSRADAAAGTTTTTTTKTTAKGTSSFHPNWPATEDALTRFSDEGLRTLVVACSVLPASWWDDPLSGWGARWAARTSEIAVEGPEEEGHFKGACKDACRRCSLELELELDAQLQLLGCTAIEDKLQKHVPQTIKSLLQAGIKVWVVTGDKRETAINIGMACNLLENDMRRTGNLLRVDASTPEGVAEQVAQCYAHVRALLRNQRKPARAGKAVSKTNGGRGVNNTRNDNGDDDPCFSADLHENPSRDLLPLRQCFPRLTPLRTPVGMVLEADSFAIIQASVGGRGGSASAPGAKSKSQDGGGGGGGDRNVSSLVLRQFLFVALHVKSLVACRCQPSSKSAIVHLLKSAQDGTTLAIGDGANDEQMIRAAHVGVGIRGLEGTSAVQASDYCISQFSFLRRLLFTHGRHSLRRVSLLICYIFYKTTLMCFCMFWFGCFSGFSGQNLVMEWPFQLFNVVFTALPILIFAVFDRDECAEVLEQNPDLYKRASASFAPLSFGSDGMNDDDLGGGSVCVGGSDVSTVGVFINRRVFWCRWMSSSFLQSLLIFFGPYAMHQSITLESGGHSQGLWELGIAVYTCVVLVVNLRLALVFRSWTWMHHAALWASLAAYFGAMIIFSLSSFFGTAGADYYGTVLRLFGQSSFWITVLVTVAAALWPEIMWEAWDRARENRERRQRFAHLVAQTAQPPAGHKRAAGQGPAGGNLSGAAAAPVPAPVPSTRAPSSLMQKRAGATTVVTGEEKHVAFALDKPGEQKKDTAIPRAALPPLPRLSPPASALGPVSPGSNPASKQQHVVAPSVSPSSPSLSRGANMRAPLIHSMPSSSPSSTASPAPASRFSFAPASALAAKGSSEPTAATTTTAGTSVEQVELSLLGPRLAATSSSSTLGAPGSPSSSSSPLGTFAQPALSPASSAAGGAAGSSPPLLDGTAIASAVSSPAKRRPTFQIIQNQRPRSTRRQLSDTTVSAATISSASASSPVHGVAASTPFLVSHLGGASATSLPRVAPAPSSFAVPPSLAGGAPPSAAHPPPKTSSPPFFQPSAALPQEEQLRLMQQYLLDRLVRGDGELILYDRHSGAGRRVRLAYRVPGPDGAVVAPRTAPLVPEEHVGGALCWTAADGSQGAFVLDPDNDASYAPSDPSVLPMRCLRLRHLRKIVDGPGESATWGVGDARQRALHSPASCFTLQSRDGRSVDMEADSPRHKLEVIYGVRVLMGAIGRGPQSIGTVAPLLKQPVAAAAPSPTAAPSWGVPVASS